ncbi:hypothetical protein ACFYO2_26295 [Streptomyces sp. NPDC006602]|uniref:hypothetical protein n=1 Tax=Streptomyces sp. NPDC006602 TaxID=3364751 RepID=UPI0036A50063
MHELSRDHMDVDVTELLLGDVDGAVHTLVEGSRCSAERLLYLRRKCATRKCCHKGTGLPLEGDGTKYAGLQVQQAGDRQILYENILESDAVY